MFILLSGIFIFGFIGIWVAVIGGLIKESKNVSKEQTQEQKIQETDDVIKWGAILIVCILVIYHGLNYLF